MICGRTVLNCGVTISRRAESSSSFQVPRDTFCSFLRFRKTIRHCTRMHHHPSIYFYIVKDDDDESVCGCVGVCAHVDCKKKKKKRGEADCLVPEIFDFLSSKLRNLNKFSFLKKKTEFGRNILSCILFLNRLNAFNQSYRYFRRKVWCPDHSSSSSSDAEKDSSARVLRLQRGPA